jgi:hypothetical protein
MQNKIHELQQRVQKRPLLSEWRERPNRWAVMAW